MANEIQTAPSTTLADNDDWEQELNLRELSMKGYDGISLTEWAAGDTDRPQIAAGSVIEIDGAIAKFTNQTAITDEGGIADGWCYIKFVVSGSDVTPTLTNTFGTWDTAKQGFYTSGARFSLHKMYRSGAVTKIFTRKQMVNVGNVYDDLNGGVYVEDGSSYAAGYKIKYVGYSGSRDNATGTAILTPTDGRPFAVGGYAKTATFLYSGVNYWTYNSYTGVLTVYFGTITSGSDNYSIILTYLTY